MASFKKSELSPDRKYRYTLWRDCADLEMFEGCNDGERGRDSFVQFIGLNPSTADETLDDPTIRRCIGFAKAWGYGALCMTNLFAFRATNPDEMKAFKFPIGEAYYNDLHLYQTAQEAALIICAWGKGGNFLERGKFVVARLKEIAENKLHHLGLNGDGTPRHPLYLPKSYKPILWEHACGKSAAKSAEPGGTNTSNEPLVRSHAKKWGLDHK